MSFDFLPVPGIGCEDVLVITRGPDAGSVVTGTEDGSVWRVSADRRRTERIAHTGGRPLGIEEHPDGSLVVCNAPRGLLRLDPATGEVEVLVDQVGAHPMRVCNNAAVAADGTIWFSDSSTRFPLEQWKDDVVHDTCTGRLLRRDPDGTVEVVMEGLDFANGVALAADESFVVVAESGKGRLSRCWLTGEQAGTHDLLVEDLGGYPDNIARGSDGLIWVAMFGPPEPLLPLLKKAPALLQRLVTRLPEALQPTPGPVLWAKAYDDTGNLVREVRIETRDWHLTTGVREHEGTLWLGSLQEAGIAAVAL